MVGAQLVKNVKNPQRKRERREWRGERAWELTKWFQRWVERREKAGNANEQPATTPARPDAPARPSYYAEDQSPGTGSKGQRTGSGRAEERRRNARNSTRVVDEMWETKGTWAEGEKA